MPTVHLCIHTEQLAGTHFTRTYRNAKPWWLIILRHQVFYEEICSRKELFERLVEAVYF